MTGKSKATDGALDAFENLLTHGSREEGGAIGTVFRFSDGSFFFLSDIDAARIRSSLASLPPPTGEPVAWGMFSSSAGCLSTTTDEAVAKRWAAETTTGISVGPLYRHPSVAPLQVEPAEGETRPSPADVHERFMAEAHRLNQGPQPRAPNTAEAEIAQARIVLAAWDINSLPNDMGLLAICEARVDDLRRLFERAEAAEAELLSLRRKVEEQRRALERLANAKALQGVRELVAGWNGEGRDDGPYERHRDELGATLPATDCGAVYELDEALSTARALAGDKP